MSVYWRTPATILTSFLAGTAFAIAHHSFYNSFNGKDPDTVLGQQWVLRIGTGFAFLVSTCLALATRTAYVQYLWQVLGTRSATISRIDSMFNVLVGHSVFLDLGFWAYHPLLCSLALITWFLPLAAVVTPGTITVSVTDAVTTRITQVAQPDWNYTNYAILEPGPAFASPSSLLSRVAISSATQGEILPIDPPAQNSSYTLDIVAPSLRCTRATEQQTNATYQSIGGDSYSTGGDYLTYLSWVPSEDYPNTSVPDTGSRCAVSSTAWSPLDVNSTDAAKIWIFITLTNTTEHVLLNCGLYNTSMRLDFNYNSSQQDIRSSSVDYLHKLSAAPDISSSAYEDFNQYNAYPKFAYQAVMYIYGQILAGTATQYKIAGSTKDRTLYGVTKLEPLIDNLQTPTDTVVGAIEQLSRNISISLMSQSQFQNNHSAAVPVMFRRTHNVYGYHQKDLWLAYGISIGFALLSVLLGFLALHQNGQSYRYDFSTILCTTSKAGLQGLVQIEDTSGAEPVSRRLAEAVVRFDRHGDDDLGRKGFEPERDHGVIVSSNEPLLMESMIRRKPVPDLQ